MCSCEKFCGKNLNTSANGFLSSIKIKYDKLINDLLYI